jgi:hypothetical protein
VLFLFDLKPDFEKGADGGGARFDALAPAVFINAMDESSRHRQDNPIGRLFSHGRPYVQPFSIFRKCIGDIIVIADITNI